MVYEQVSSLKFDVRNINRINQIGRAVSKAVHERDNHTCHFCGLRSTKYQQVLDVNNNFRDMRSLVTVCVFCQQVFFLDAVIQMRSGNVIKFDALTQVEINMLAVEIYLARSTASGRMDLAAAALKKLTIDQGGPTTLPLLSEALHHKDATETEKKKFQEEIKGMRLLPLDRRIMKYEEMEFNQFPQIINFWRSIGDPYMRHGEARFERLDRFAEQFL